jgi:hypothetical protein
MSAKAVIVSSPGYPDGDEAVFRVHFDEISCNQSSFSPSISATRQMVKRCLSSPRSGGQRAARPPIPWQKFIELSNGVLGKAGQNDIDPQAWLANILARIAGARRTGRSQRCAMFHGLLAKGEYRLRA